MGWLFAVALGMQKGSAVAKALVGSPEGVAQSQLSMGGSARGHERRHSADLAS